jgi:hypothetical protein
MNKSWGAMRAEHVDKGRVDRYEQMPSLREMKVYATDLLYGREGASKLLGLSVNTIRNASKHVRMYYGGESNTATAINLGWLQVPEEYLQ